MTLISRFCLALGTLPLVSPLDQSLPCQVKERAEQKHQDKLATWTFKKQVMDQQSQNTKHVESEWYS